MLMFRLQEGANASILILVLGGDAFKVVEPLKNVGVLVNVGGEMGLIKKYIVG